MKSEKNKRLLKNLVTKVKAILPAFFICGVVVFLIYASSLLKVGRIECLTEYGPCTKSLRKTFNPLLGRNLILTGRDEVKAVVKSRLEASDVKIKKRLPETLVVDIEIAKARVAIPQEGKFKLLDLSGNVVGEMQESALPVLSISSNLSEIPNSDVIWAVETLYYLEVLGFDVSASLKDGEMTLNVDGTEVVLSKNRESVLAAGSLQFMMARFKMEGKTPVKIDLRFKNPVVIF